MIRKKLITGTLGLLRYASVSFLPASGKVSQLGSNLEWLYCGSEGYFDVCSITESAFDVSGFSTKTSIQMVNRGKVHLRKHIMFSIHRHSILKQNLY